MHILFVCTGNICRSPTAERLAVAYGEQSGRLRDFRASSAGTHAMTGQPIEPSAARVLLKLDCDTSRFAARQLTPPIAANADLVLAMTRAHRDHVLKLAPQQLHKTFTLREAAGLVLEFNAQNVSQLAAFRPRLPAQRSPDIPDPMGHNEAFFAVVGSQIADLLPPVLELCRHG